MIGAGLRGGMALKIAVPTDDGVRVSHRFGRASSFVVAEVRAGEVLGRQVRANPVGSRVREGLSRRRTQRGRERQVVVADLLADCRAVIAYSIGQRMRDAMERQGIEVVITSEALVDRAIALFSLLALLDESRVDPEDEELEPAPVPEMSDDFDG